MRPKRLHPLLAGVRAAPDTLQRTWGQRRSGAVPLWCSERLVPHDEELTARELRAYGRGVAWRRRCGPARGEAEFERLVRAGLDAGPSQAAGQESAS